MILQMCMNCYDEGQVTVRIHNKDEVMNCPECNDPAVQPVGNTRFSNEGC